LETVGFGNVNLAIAVRILRITFRKFNNNSLVLQHMLKMLPSWPNALTISAPVEHVGVNSLEFFSGNR
jgi:hypothetical protein